MERDHDGREHHGSLVVSPPQRSRTGSRRCVDDEPVPPGMLPSAQGRWRSCRSRSHAIAAPQRRPHRPEPARRTARRRRSLPHPGPTGPDDWMGDGGLVSPAASPSRGRGSGERVGAGPQVRECGGASSWTHISSREGRVGVCPVRLRTTSPQSSTRSWKPVRRRTVGATGSGHVKSAQGVRGNEEVGCRSRHAVHSRPPARMQ